MVTIEQRAQEIVDYAPVTIARLVDEPSEALRLAARAHHVRRWTIPRGRDSSKAFSATTTI